MRFCPTDHVHLVFGPTPIDIDQVAIQLKGYASSKLLERNLHPFRRDNNGKLPKCFARGEWKVYLDAEDVPRAIEYVENYPIKEGLPRQKWSFVQECD